MMFINKKFNISRYAGEAPVGSGPYVYCLFKQRVVKQKKKKEYDKEKGGNEGSTRGFGPSCLGYPVFSQ